MKKIVYIFLLYTFFATALASNNNINEIKIYKNLRCLVCQGQSIADSNSEFSQTIKEVVQDQINLGKSEKEIYAFLTDKYGEWILYKPKYNKLNSFLWMSPYIILFFGGIFILYLVKKRKNYRNN